MLLTGAPCYLQNPCLEFTLRKQRVQALPAPCFKKPPTGFTEPLKPDISTLFSTPVSRTVPQSFTFPRNASSQLAEDLSPFLHAGCRHLDRKPLQCIRNLKPHPEEKPSAFSISTDTNQGKQSVSPATTHAPGDRMGAPRV